MNKTHKGTLTEVLDFICRKKRGILVFRGWREGDIFFVRYGRLKMPKPIKWR